MATDALGFFFMRALFLFHAAFISRDIFSTSPTAFRHIKTGREYHLAERSFSTFIASIISASAVSCSRQALSTAPRHAIIVLLFYVLPEQSCLQSFKIPTGVSPRGLRYYYIDRRLLRKTEIKFVLSAASKNAYAAAVRPRKTEYGHLEQKCVRRIINRGFFRVSASIVAIQRHAAHANLAMPPMMRASKKCCFDFSRLCGGLLRRRISDFCAETLRYLIVLLLLVRCLRIGESRLFCPPLSMSLSANSVSKAGLQTANMMRAAARAYISFAIDIGHFPRCLLPMS